MDIPLFHVARRRKYKAKSGSDYRFAHKGDTFPYHHHEASLREAPVCNEAWPKLDNVFTTTYMCHDVTPCHL